MRSDSNTVLRKLDDSENCLLTRFKEYHIKSKGFKCCLVSNENSVSSIVNVRVDLPLKPKFCVLLPGKRQPKLAMRKISNVSFCKLVQITKRVDTFRQGVLSFGKSLYFTDHRFFS